MSSVESIFTGYRASMDDLPAALLTVATVLKGSESKAEQPIGKSEYLTIKQAAREFNLSERALYRLTDLHVRRGKSVRIKRKDLEAHLEGTESLFD